MTFQEILVGAGFSQAEAAKLAGDEYFAQRNSNKSAEEISASIRSMAGIYSCSEDDARKAVLSHPRFAGLDHKRVLEGIEREYGCERAQSAKAVLSFPQFAGRDHKRVLRQLSRIGRIAGADQSRVIEEILKRPVLASYSAKRYLAAIDIGRELRKEGLHNDSAMVDVWLKNDIKSPYVPGTKRLRISQARETGVYDEASPPPLMAVLRRGVERRKLAA